MPRRNWTREELLLALNLYCKLPFSKFSSSTPEIKQLATIIQRTPSAVAMKLSNFASLDPSLEQAGLRHGGKLDKEIWDEFTGNWNKVALESEEILEAKFHNLQTNRQIIGRDINKASGATETKQTIKARLGQKFFRSAVLGIYEFRCCICDLPIESLLIASHIKPWHIDEANRLNPQNGLSLCAIHDKAFDRGLITITENYTVLISPQITSFQDYTAVEFLFASFHHKAIHKPKKFVPKQEFLKYHYEKIFLE